MANVSAEQIATAIEWLGINEGDQGEREGCAAVAGMLQKMLDRRVEEAAIRSVAKEQGVTASEIRTRVSRAKAVQAAQIAKAAQANG